MHNLQLQPGYVLHHHDYRDTSLLLEVFTRDQGRFGLVARGARAPRSRIRGLLQPFQPLLLSWSARGDLGTLHSVEAAGAPPALRGAALYSGFYLNELLLRLLQRLDAHAAVFAAYADALNGLQTEAERPLRLFEKRLLDALGYGLLLDREADSGQAVAAEVQYSYELESGPVRRGPGAASGLEIAGNSLLSFAAEDLSDAQSLADAKRLMRAALGLYLGDRELKTREVFAAVTGQ